MKHALAVAFLTASLCTLAGEPLEPRTTPPDPHFNRLAHNDEIVEHLKGYAAAYPDWVKLESIGKTTLGRDTWLLAINNPATGKADDKPAFYVDGATHANEAQGADTVLYLINFMLDNYGKLDRLTETMDRAAFYFVPIVSADSRAKWFDEPSTESYPRTVQVPVDDDRDGAMDEDGFDDLDKDGSITRMRKKVPLGQGDFRLHPKDPRIMVTPENDELGDYIMLGAEGFDNDGDGSVNEDTVGYIDPNRSWGYNWQPRYVQSGACQYPLQIPETGNIAFWAAKKQNIAAVQSFHNFGQMILRGPGAKSTRVYPGPDVQVFDYLGEEGEKMLPGYEYMVSWKDLYTVYGGTSEHFYSIHGAMSFTNELNQRQQDFDGDGLISAEEQMKFNDQMALGRMFVDWKPYEHPQYGDIEIGGFKFDTGRAPEGWKLEEECHRNSAFVLFHAYHLPFLEIGEPEVLRVDGNLWEIYVPVTNKRAMHSRTHVARRDNLHRADIAGISGDRAKVVSSGIVQDRWHNKVTLQEHRPGRLMVEGVDGMSMQLLYFLVEGTGTVTMTYDSQKAGKLARTIQLK